MKLDIKSLVAGLLAGIAITLSIAANGTEDPKSTVGRYQITSSETSYFVLDSQTGQVWANDGRLKRK